jgi:hypothetical protein
VTIRLLLIVWCRLLACARAARLTVVIVTAPAAKPRRSTRRRSILVSAIAPSRASPPVMLHAKLAENNPGTTLCFGVP